MQDNKFSLSRIVLLFLQGALIGTGAILPGISGGVLCVAFGLYEPMVGLFVHPWQSLRRNYRLFIPLILGGGLGFLLLARAVEYLLTVAAVSTIRKEMNSTKWTLASIGWQLGAAWLGSFLVYQLGSLVLRVIGC